uniref:Poly [ADP-ribose] polymerase n=1 Tax=Erpetoichthys calabaricus TaxID=27687 RepID=A0A8C4T003_ERPCA
MAPKRKAAAGTKGAKKVKTEPEDAFRLAKEVLKSVSKGGGTTNVDAASVCLLVFPSSQIYANYACILNQTNAGSNKFYIIQVIKAGISFYCWNRWGHVGEGGEARLAVPTCLLQIKEVTLFLKMFKDKTENDWKNKDNFKAHPGKYTPMQVESKAGRVTSIKVSTSPLRPLGGRVLHFILTDVVLALDLSHQLLVPRGPLTKLVKGLEALEELEKAHKKKSSEAKLRVLSFHFYTIISQKIWYKRLPIIKLRLVLHAKREILMILAGIQQAKSLQAENQKAELEVEEILHPIDQDYKLLKCGLTRLNEKSENYQVGASRTERCMRLKTMGKRFKTHNGIENRRLLWHGTKMASIAAILKSGLRVMPHSGGRVGKGIYFASENSKSENFVWHTSNRIGIMFLNEVSLGKEYTITKDDSSLVQAPDGYDCVVARGQTEPDASKDVSIILDGKKVMVPQGKPLSQKEYSSSRFSQSEYVIYKESQCRIRYLLQLKF